MKLGMERCGFKPEDTFSPEQIKKMREMTAGTFKYPETKSKIVTLNIHKKNRQELRDCREKSDIKLKNNMAFTEMILSLGIEAFGLTQL